MKERPILFSAPMVRAIIEGRKTQTRRIVKPVIPTDVEEVNEEPALDPILKCVVSGNSGWWQDGHGLDLRWHCPYGIPGDRIWVKETFAPRGVEIQSDGRRCAVIQYRATGERLVVNHEPIQREIANWRPSIFMPRWASRITLEIGAVRAERLQDVSEDDAIAEGITPSEHTIECENGSATLQCELPPRVGDTMVILGRINRTVPHAVSAYRHLWKEINGPDSWAKNPWVWVIEFKVISS